MRNHPTILALALALALLPGWSGCDSGNGEAGHPGSDTPESADLPETGDIENNPDISETDSTCTPDCSDKECSEDGCGGLCGVCDPNQTCVQGICVGPAVCGNGECEPPFETSENCADDCEPVEPVCGDGICTPPEHPETCYEDCVGVDPDCGDGKCVPPAETSESCPEDCQEGVDPVCGDGKCVPPTETLESCPEDCKEDAPECGDGICTPSESPQTCPEDCQGDEIVCGDGECTEPPETKQNCPEDCGEIIEIFCAEDSDCDPICPPAASLGCACVTLADGVTVTCAPACVVAEDCPAPPGMAICLPEGYCTPAGGGG